MIIQVIIPPIPAELIVIGAAAKYGIFLTTLFAGFGLFIGSIIAYYFGYYLRKFNKYFFKKEKVRIVTEKIKKYGLWLLLIRVLPYNPSDIISYAAGILKFNKKKYIIITFFVAFTRVLILSILGSFIVDIKSLLVIISILFISAIIASAFIFNKN